MMTMARSLKDKLATLDPARRAAIEAEADRLHAEYLTLQELRKAKKLTQVQLAETLGVQQAFGGVSRVIAPIWATAAFQGLGRPVPFYIAAAVVGIVAILAFRVRPTARLSEATAEVGG